MLVSVASITEMASKASQIGLGEKAGIKLDPHDLRRPADIYASRNEVPLEIISNVILRHQDLKTTQVYLGKVSESESLR